MQKKIERLMALLEEESSRLRFLLAEGASDAELKRFEEKIGLKLPKDYKTLYRAFNGQKSLLPMIEKAHFVALSEVATLQKRWLAFVEKHYGKQWKKVTFDEEIFIDEDQIRNTLFDGKWIPLLADEDSFLCMDLNPAEDGNYGQVIQVVLAEELEDYQAELLFDSVEEWIEDMVDLLNDGALKYDEETQSLKFLSDEEPFLYDKADREALEDYIGKAFGKCEEVFHEIVSPDIHCDIYIIKPTPEKNHYTLITGGMGAFPMFVPEESDVPMFAELMIHLPPDWNIKSEDEKDYWPIRWLKTLARLPIEHRTYLAFGHTIPTGENLAGTKFNAFMLHEAGTAENINGVEEDDEYNAVVELPSGRDVQFYHIVPLYSEEVQYKLNYGAHALMGKFVEAGISYPPVVDIRRTNACEGYEADECPSLLDQIAWSFDDENRYSLMHFWDDVKAYNKDNDNDIEDFNPFATLFKSPKVKIVYKCYIADKNKLPEGHTLFDSEKYPPVLDDGMYAVVVVKTLESEEKEGFGVINFLRHLHNTFADVDLGGYEDFVGLKIISMSDAADGVPVVIVNLQ